MPHMGNKITQLGTYSGVERDLAMLGPAELREINEALSEERGDGSRADKSSPYLTTHFAVGMAMTRAATAGLKAHSLTQPFKR